MRAVFPFHCPLHRSLAHSWATVAMLGLRSLWLQHVHDETDKRVFLCRGRLSATSRVRAARPMSLMTGSPSARSRRRLRCRKSTNRKAPLRLLPSAKGDSSRKNIVVSNRAETRRRAEDSTDSTARRANTVSVLFETTIKQVRRFAFASGMAGAPKMLCSRLPSGAAKPFSRSRAKSSVASPRAMSCCLKVCSAVRASCTLGRMRRFHPTVLAAGLRRIAAARGRYGCSG